MNIPTENLDSRMLRWSGFALAAFIATAFVVGAPGSASSGASMTDQVDSRLSVRPTAVRIGRLADSPLPASVLR